MDTVKIKSRGAKMIAHRGVSGLERENTCPAFVAAGNRSYFGVETDVHVTKDKKFVIIHDETTDRVSNGAVCMNVEQSKLEDALSVVLPDRDGSTYRRDIRIPTLAEYILICKKYGKKCVLELKNPFEHGDLVAIVEEIKSLGYIENVIFISFSLTNCVEIKKLLPDNEVQFLTGDEVGERLIDTLLAHGLDLDIYFSRLNAENVALLHSKGIKVNCWTVDGKADGEALAAIGVDYITSNILE